MQVVVVGGPRVAAPPRASEDLSNGVGSGAGPERLRRGEGIEADRPAEARPRRAGSCRDA